MRNSEMRLCYGANPRLKPFTTAPRLARTPPPKPKAPARAVEAPPLLPTSQSPPAQNMQNFVPTGPAIPTQLHRQPRVVHSPPLSAQQQQQQVVRSPPVPTLARIAAGLAAASEVPVAAPMSVLEIPVLAPPALTAASEREETAAVESPGSLHTTTTNIVTNTTTLGEAQTSGTPPLIETQAAAPAPLSEPINQATPITTMAIDARSDTTVDPPQKTQDVSPVVASNEVSPPLPQPLVAETVVSVQSTEQLVVEQSPSLEVQKKVNFEEAALPVAKAQQELQHHQQQQEQQSEHANSATIFVTPSVEKASPPLPPPVVVSSPLVSAAAQRPAFSLPAMPAPVPVTAPDPPPRDAPSARCLIANILSSASSSSRVPIGTTTAASTTCMATVSPRMGEQPLTAKASAPAPAMSAKTVSKPSPSLPAAHVAFNIRNFTQSMKKGAPVAEMKPVAVADDFTSTRAAVKAMEEQEEDGLDAPIATMVDMSSPVQSAEGEAMATTSAFPAIPTSVSPAPAAAPAIAAARMEVVVKETRAEEDMVTAAKATLTQQEAELQDELSRLRANLIKQKAESQRLMESWTQAQEALKESGAELNGVQRERRRLSVEVSRLNRNFTTTKERIPLLLEETDKVRMEAHRVKLEQLKERCELTASVRAFDRLCELERRLKIKLVHQEAASYDARSTYLQDYSTMCSFGRIVSLKAFELMGRVKEGVGKVKGAMQFQRGELQKQAAEASKQAAQASKESAAEIARLANREADQQKELQKVEVGKKKAEKRLIEAEKRASEEVRRLESMVSSRGNEIKKLEDELKKLRRDRAKAAAVAAKAAKVVASTKMTAAQKKTVKKAEEEAEEEDREEEQQQEEEEGEEQEIENVSIAAAKTKGSRKRTTSTARPEDTSAPKKVALSRQPKKRAAVRSAPVSQKQDVKAEQAQAVKATPVVATAVTADSSSSSPGLPFALSDAVDAIPEVLEAHADKDFEEEVLPVSKRAAFRASTNKCVVQETQSEEQGTKVSENSPAAPPHAKRSRGASLSEPTQELTAMASPPAPAATTTESLRHRSSRNKNDSPVATHAAAAAPLGEQSKSAMNEQAQMPIFAPVALKQPEALPTAPSVGPSAVPRTTSMTTTKHAAKASTLKPSEGCKKNSIFSSFINKGAIPRLKKQK